MLSFLDALKRILVGRPFRTERLKEAPLRKRLALPIFSASALSSIAYAPDEVILTLALAGLGAMAFSPSVGLAVMVVMLVIIASYRQSVKAYPSGGGDYEIASVNLGPRAGTTVAAALLVDFVLTVAVSISSASHYVIAAFPALDGSQAWFATAGVVVLTVLNLRGRGRSKMGTAAPVYLFIGVVLVMLAAGGILAATGTLGTAPSAGFEVVPDPDYPHGLTGLAGVLLVLRAFSTGSAALTGVEVPISNVHKLAAPKARNSAAVLLLLGLFAGALTLGTMYLARAVQVRVVEDPATGLRLDGGPIPADYIQHPVLGQVAEAIFGGASIGFYLVLAVTVAVLLIAAHTAFNSFPNLASHLATDGYLPRQLRTRGDRLGFSNGILALAIAAIALIWVFDAHVPTLIQLYVVGVFVSFTLSQLGMIRHWGRELAQTPDKRVRARIHRSRLLNLAGFALTAAVLLIVLGTRLVHGAWLAVLGIAVLFAMMDSLHRHYVQVDRELAIGEDESATALPARVHALVLVSTLRKPVLRAVAFARAARPSKLDAIVVDADSERTEATLARWEALGIPVPITVLASPYREIAPPLIEHIRSIKRDSPRDLIVVYIPEYVVGRWWEQLVHNQTAMRIKNRLHYEPGVVVASVPWRLASSDASMDLGPTEEASAGAKPMPHPAAPQISNPKDKP
ncbi:MULTISPECIES: APC family permease [Paeniglutamicibacter]|uniref:Amino acid transporter n=1 Tax=Paeniglutamicibacter sulfureus TaxID=43666 RepID=A0ABU2BE57_9MICC|nr:MULTISPECIES: APC family permease [Paeniglutamicibacter]MCV9995365.1 APC family permease [Paeniglutamicibacter sp. ZC-3]MDO2936422.1 APC family permease [Paeniglutamicibacter sulfureus]MDR7356927.1 amino acid transporter [Paeniglutamicibacter sulfureus]